MVRMTRKFNGKTYTARKISMTKGDARKVAEHHRNKGLNVRFVKKKIKNTHWAKQWRKSEHNKNVYVLYFRKSRRSR